MRELVKQCGRAEVNLAPLLMLVGAMAATKDMPYDLENIMEMLDTEEIQ